MMLRNGIIDRGALLKFFQDISEEDYKKMQRGIERGMQEREMFFHGKGGKIRKVPMTIRPFFISKRQRDFFRKFYLFVDDAVKKVFWLYKENPKIKEVIPLTEEEEKWFAEADLKKTLHQNYFGRVDVTVDLYNPNFEKTFKVLEINMVGIGATYYSRSSTFIADEIVKPTIMKNKFPLRIKKDDDYISIILHKILEHSKVNGTKKPTIGLMQDESVLEGPFEFHNVADFYNSKGYKTYVVDPEWLEKKDLDIYCRGKKIDILYRDPTLQNLIEMEEERNTDLSVVRFAFQKNRVVSCITGEFDHKSVLEIFTNNVFSKKLSLAQRNAFKKYIPWTRAVREVKTNSIEDKKVDLIEYIRREKDRLILKPNRDYGGNGIIFGCNVTLSEWDKAIDFALRKKSSYVAQEMQNIYSDFFPVVKNNRVEFEEFYTVLGFSATRGGTSFLGRLAKEKVVNITRSGSVAGIFIY